MSNRDEKIEGRMDKLNKALRKLQKSAAQLDAVLNRSEQEENNRLLSLRIEERKAARQDLAVADVIKDGTPEEKAMLRLKDYDLTMMGGTGFLSKEDINELHFSYETTEEKAVFLNYLKLYNDMRKCDDKLLYVIKMYEVEIVVLSKLIDKYEAIQRSIMLYGILYGSLVMGGGHTGMGYNITDRDKDHTKSLDETTPESLLAEFNEKHKGDGVVYRSNIKGNLEWGTLHNSSSVTLSGWKNQDDSDILIADIDFEGGLHDQLRKQAKKCEETLSYVKAYIEPIEEYIKKNFYSSFVPSQLKSAIKGIKLQDFSKSLIANEFHRSSRGECEAFVPDYREVVADQEVKDSCYLMIKNYRNAEFRKI